MTRPSKSQSAANLQRLRSSHPWRRTRADLRELILLERAAKRACFISIARSVSRLAKANAASAGRSVKSNEADHAAKQAANWPGKIADAGVARESGSAGRNTPDHSVMLAVDQRLAMRFGSRGKTKSVVAAEIAAFIAWRGLAQQTRVGALIFNDKKVDLLCPICSRLSVMLILHALLNQNHALSNDGESSFNADMLNRVLRRVEQLATNESTIFLITDASGHDRETERLLAAISQRTQLRLLLVDDPRQKKFSKTPGLFSKGFALPLQVQNGRAETRGLTARSPSKSSAQELPSETIPLLRFSTWEDPVAQLRRASRKSILPPQTRPTRSDQQPLNGHEIPSHAVQALNSKEGARSYDEADSATTLGFRPRSFVSA